MTVASSEAGGAARQLGEARLRFRQRAGEELALGPIELEREGQIVTPLPRVLRQQRGAGGEVGQRRGVGGRGLGAPARNQVQLGEPLALLGRADQRGAAVSWPTISKTLSSMPLPGRRAASRRPMARCAAARSPSGISA